MANNTWTKRTVRGSDRYNWTIKVDGHVGEIEETELNHYAIYADGEYKGTVNTLDAAFDWFE